MLNTKIKNIVENYFKKKFKIIVVNYVEHKD